MPTSFVVFGLASLTSMNINFTKPYFCGLHNVLKIPSTSFTLQVFKMLLKCFKMQMHVLTIKLQMQPKENGKILRNLYLIMHC